MGEAALGVPGRQAVPVWPASTALPPLGALLTAPSLIRACVRATLAMWKMTDLADAVELAVSELATNGVNASTGEDGCPMYVDGRLPVIRVRLFTDGRRLVAEVWDQAPGVAVHRSAGDDDETGRGLDLVDALTGSRWGWHPTASGQGKCVWAEFQVPPAAVPSGGTNVQEGHPR